MMMRMMMMMMMRHHHCSIDSGFETKMMLMISFSTHAGGRNAFVASTVTAVGVIRLGGSSTREEALHCHRQSQIACQRIGGEGISLWVQNCGLLDFLIYVSIL